MKIPFWRVEPVWEGETVAILGGGPSLTQRQVDACRGRCRVIAVNNAYQLAPWADLLYFCDEVWYGWHREHKAFRGFSGIKAALSNARTWPRDPYIRVLQNYGDSGLCEIPDGVMTGRNSGYQAMNLAAHLGPARQLLLGFDMRVVGNRTHWHMEHKRATPHDAFAVDMLPRFPALKQALDARGIEVVNCTPGSALEVFRKDALENALHVNKLTLCSASGA